MKIYSLIQIQLRTDANSLIRRIRDGNSHSLRSSVDTQNLHLSKFIITLATTKIKTDGRI